MLAATRTTLTVQEVYTRLMRARRGFPIEVTLARILSSWSLGLGAMPRYIGLEEKDFNLMMEYAFPYFDPEWLPNPDNNIDPLRADETQDLRKLLLRNRSGESDSEYWMVDILTAGCMGNDHLWQDLGLWCRNDLSKLMAEHFSPLADKNDKDMKWKKFLYKQLCQEEGIYTCRAPSCEVCLDYASCFGPEE